MKKRSGAFMKKAPLFSLKQHRATDAVKMAIYRQTVEIQIHFFILCLKQKVGTCKSKLRWIIAARKSKSLHFGAEEEKACRRATRFFAKKEKRKEEKKITGRGWKKHGYRTGVTKGRGSAHSASTLIEETFGIVDSCNSRSEVDTSR